MKKILLDGAPLAEREQAMALLESSFDLPGWWGRNLDALSDCLWDLGQPVEVTVEHSALLSSTLFGLRLLRVLEDCAGQNPHFSLTLL